jgi:uncharacterized protein (DUF1697 family)
MAQVVFIKGVNVGGHRRFRPSELVRALKSLDIVSIGAAGTFVVRKRIGRSDLRQQIVGRLPFPAHVMICDGRDLVRLAQTVPFAGERRTRDVIQFVSILAKRCASPPVIPFGIPERGPWGVRVLACHGRFILGVHRRQMKAIGQLGHLEKVFGAPVTTRSWTTIQTIVRVLSQG